MGKISETLVFNKTKGQKHKVFCANCKLETNHVVLQSVDSEASEVIRYYDNLPDTVDWSNNYQIIQCQGCDTISFQQRSWCSENVCQIGPDDWDDGYSSTLYPYRSDNTRITKDYNNLPRTLRRIYHETIECFNNNSLTLCAAGLRAIIEGICANQQITDGPVHIQENDSSTRTVRKKNLEGKIAGLYEKGILTQQNTVILHEHRYLGNDAVHELNLPTSHELILALDIVEHIFDSLYEMPDKAAELQLIREKN